MANRARGQPELPPKPTAKDFEPGEVQKAILTQTLTSEKVTYPLFAALAFVTLGLFSQFSPELVAAILLSGGTSAGIWAYNYLYKGQELAESRVRELRELRKRHELIRVEEIEQLCRVQGFTEGAKEAKELREAYLKLRRYLETELSRTNDLELQQWLVLAEDTYEKGTNILRYALSLYVALSQINIRSLEREKANWDKQLAILAEGDPEREPLAAQISAHGRRIDRYRENERTIRRLIAESNTVESHFETVLLELPSLSTEGAEVNTFRDRSRTELEKALEVAKTVEENLRNLGATDRPGDDEYARVGRQ